MSVQVPKRLVTVPANLRRNRGIAIAYHALRTMAIEGLIPAFQINNIWHVYDEDEQAIADAVDRRAEAADRRVGRYARVAA